MIDDDRDAREFVLALDDSLRLIADPLNPTTAERTYSERVVKQRLHQREFRARVIHAYGMQCAICELNVPLLLDAAHILPDRHELGQPVVQNGLSLCKLHHTAYDHNLLGITRDLEVRLDASLLRQSGGPMLLHGLQDMHGERITTPSRRRDHPDRERLAQRYLDFLAVQDRTPDTPHNARVRHGSVAVAQAGSGSSSLTLNTDPEQKALTHRSGTRMPDAPGQ